MAPSGMPGQGGRGPIYAVAPPPSFPLSLSGNGRNLQTARGWRFLPNIAAASWDWIQALSLARAIELIDTQVARGFNSIHVSAVSRDTVRFGSDTATHFAAPDWKTPGGTTVPPFTTPGDFSTFNPTYITHLQDFLRYCANKVCRDGTKGVLVFLIAPYIGYQLNQGEGWGDLMVTDTDAHLQAFGVALATAIAEFKNVIMVAGGDYRPSPGSAIESRMLAFVTGFLSVDATRIWGGHFDGSAGNGGDLSYEQTAFAALIPSGFLLYSLYWYDEAAKRGRRRIREARAHSPTGAACVFDKSYLNDNATSSRRELRASTNACMGNGSCSMTHAVGGNSPDGWVFCENLNSTTATVDHEVAWDFWSSIPWDTMSPDDSGTFVTAGRGSDSDTTDIYVEVLGSIACVAVYIPHASQVTNGDITFNMAALTGDGFVTPAGARRLSKIDPTNGARTVLAAAQATSGTVTIGPSGTYTLGTNAAGDSDWIVEAA